MKKTIAGFIAYILFMILVFVGWGWPIFVWLWTNVHYPYWFGG